MSGVSSTTTPTGLDNIIDFFKKNAITLSIAIYLIVILYYTAKKPDDLFTDYYLYMTIFIVPLLFGIVYALTTIEKTTNTIFPYKLGINIEITPLFIIRILVGIIILYFIGTTNLSENMIYLATGFIQLVFILMIIVALAIVYKIGYNYIYKMQGWAGLIVNLIFYIPCMLLDLLEFAKADLQQAPKAVPALLLIELVLLLIYLYGPKISDSLVKSLSNKDGKVILREPVSIREEKKVSSYVELQNIDNKTDDMIVNNKYAISAWIYIVPVEPSHSPYNGDATIFEFTDYHPRLIYNGAKGKLKAFLNEGKYEEIDVPLQKWNHVVFNYTKSNADLFVNGELKASVKRENENFTIGDTIVIGQKGGLTGGVCNMVYFKRPLAKHEIQSIYLLNKDLETPVV